MKIVACTGLFMPSIGGYQLSTHQTLLALHNQGIDVIVLAGHLPNDDEFDNSVPYTVIRCGSASYWGAIQATWKMRNVFRKEKADFCMIMGHYNEVAFGLISYLLPSLRPVILAAGTRIAFSMPRRKRVLGEWLLGRCYRRSKIIIAISQQTVDIITQNCNIERKHFCIIPRPVNSLSTNTSDTNTHKSGLKLLTVSRIEKQKNIDQVLFIVKKLIDNGISVSYTVVGDGDHLVALRTLVSEYNITTQVSFVGSIAPEDIGKFYAETDLFILLSKANQTKNVILGESFGRVYAEAFSAGVPAIGYNTSAVADVIDHEENGFLCEIDDTDACYAYICQLHHDKELLKSMSQRAREKYLSTYTPEKVGSQFKEVLSVLV